MRLGHHLDEIPVAGLVQDVKAQVRAYFVRISLKMRSVSNVRFASQDRLYGSFRQRIAIHALVCRATFVVELLEGEEVAVVGDGKRRHAKFTCPPD